MSTLNLAGKRSGGAGSPMKKGKITKFAPKTSKGCHISSVGFPPLGVELCCYSKIEKGEFVEGHTHPFKKFVDEEDSEYDVPSLRLTGFASCVPKRVSRSDNTVLNGSDGWSRFWMMR